MNQCSYHPNIMTALNRYHPSLEIIEDRHVSDYKEVKRSWKERLFKRPWQPFKKTKTIYSPTIYFMFEKTFVCSPQTAGIIRSSIA